MIAPEPIHPFPWRICAAAALFTLLMVAAAVAANIFTISGNGKLPLMVPGLLALGWLIWKRCGWRAPCRDRRSPAISAGSCR